MSPVLVMASTRRFWPSKSLISKPPPMRLCPRRPSRRDRPARDVAEMHSIAGGLSALPVPLPDGHGSGRALPRVPHTQSNIVTLNTFAAPEVASLSGGGLFSSLLPSSSGIRAYSETLQPKPDYCLSSSTCLALASGSQPQGFKAYALCSTYVVHLSRVSVPQPNLRDWPLESPVERPRTLTPEVVFPAPQ